MPQHFRTTNAPEQQPKNDFARRDVGKDGGVQAPINAAQAAHRAARADVRDLDRLRREAAGNAASGAPGASHARARRGAEASSRSRRALMALGLCIGCGLAALVLFFGGRAVVNALLQDDAPAASKSAQADSTSAVQEGVARFSDNETLASGGYVYSIVKDGKAYAFAFSYEGSNADPSPLFSITGDPVGFALYEGVFYVVSNTDDAWCIQSFVFGDGSLPSDFYSEEGHVEDLALTGSALVVTTAGGQEKTVELPHAEA